MIPLACGLRGWLSLQWIRRLSEFVERQSEFGGKIAGKDEIGIRFIAAQAVVEMGSMEHQAKLVAARCE